MHRKKEHYIQAATAIGFKICRDAIWHEDRCNWITSHLEDNTGYPKPFFKSLESDLYGGTSGIAYFLSALYHAQPDHLIERTCYGAIRQALSRLHKFDARSSLGFFSGRLGVAFSIIKAAGYLNDPSLASEGVAHLLTCLDQPPDSCGLDVIEGCGGAVPVLLNIYDDLQMEELREAAIRIGDYILTASRQEQVGLSWDTTPFKKHNLTGFAHGAAGMVNALFELYSFTGEEKYRVAASEGIAYENHHFNHAEKNWPDFRSFNNPSFDREEVTPCSCAWCHGAPGIGLSRLRAYAITGDLPFKTDALAAIETTLKHQSITPYSNFSLCHGLFGNAELLVEGSRVLDDPSLLKATEELADNVYDQYIARGIPMINGVNNTYDNPELMTGLAGMGYFYLRLWDLEQFDSVLQLKQRKAHREQFAGAGAVADRGEIVVESNIA